jgi:hypothetical protein
MRAVSFTKEELNLIIRNQYPGLELISPVYFSNSATCRVSSSQQTGIGTKAEASFGINFEQEDFRCALLYKLQRKRVNGTDDQLDSGVAFIEDTTTSMYILIVWNTKYIYYRFRVCLMEFTDDYTWDEHKLWHCIVNIGINSIDINLTQPHGQ